MLIASQFLLWVVAALLFIAVLALSRQVSGLRARLEQGAPCPQGEPPREPLAEASPARPTTEPTSFA